VVAAAAVAVVVVAATTGDGSRHGGTAAPSPTIGRVVSASVWRVLSSAPTARQQMASTVSGGVLWFFGGLTNGVATTKVEGFDPAISAWEAGPDLPVKLHHDMAVLYHGDMVVMGGWIPQGSTLDAVASNRVFVLRNGGWVELPAMHHARAAGAAAVVGDKIVVSGGQANHQLVPATEVFDGVRWTDVAPIPTPRDHLAGATDGKFFYAVGGRDLSADKNVGAVERYDPVTNVWARMPSLPTPRGGLGAVVSGSRLVTIGGESSTGVYGTVEVLDLRTNTWTTLPAMRTPRHGLAVLAVRNTIYTVDGAKAAGHTDSVPTNEAIDLSCGPGADCPS
jgi:non-specific serine/threonine protein kinase